MRRVCEGGQRALGVRAKLERVMTYSMASIRDEGADVCRIMEIKVSRKGREAVSLAVVAAGTAGEDLETNDARGAGR